MRACDGAFAEADCIVYDKWNLIVDVVHNSFTSQIIAFYELCKFEIFDSTTFSSEFISASSQQNRNMVRLSLIHDMIELCHFKIKPKTARIDFEKCLFLVLPSSYYSSPIQFGAKNRQSRE